LETQVRTQSAATAQDGSQARFIDVLGTRMHYVHGGSGRPMLLIHGIVGSTTNWRRNIAALARNASVYAIDLVNMGRSQRVAGIDADLEASADRVAAFMDAMGIDQAEIIGHSHGGAVSTMLAARHPDRVRSLILFAPVNPFSHLEAPLIRLYSSTPGRLLARVVPYLPRWVHQIALERMYGDPTRIAEGTLDGYIEGLRVPGTIQHVMAIVGGWYRNIAALKTALSQVTHVPTLLMWGDRDRAVSVASGRQLLRELRDAELIVVPGAGHVVFEEMPEECNRAMCDWLARSRTASPQTNYLQPRGPRLTPLAPRTPLSSTLQQAARRA
jgi:4,5:9,10-diseco-3-hydroxy-5,9,17-trioxoandrosta-1(10),2-diene-4-oate hydrolase